VAIAPQHGTQQIIGSAQRTHHIECHGKLIDSGRVHAHAAAGGKANLGADIGKNLAQYVDILDIGQVFKRTGRAGHIEAGIMATAAFFAPLIVTVPSSGLPPRMLYHCFKGKSPCVGLAS
jgi:hypothetical protein